MFFFIKKTKTATQNLSFHPSMNVNTFSFNIACDIIQHLEKNLLANKNKNKSNISIITSTTTENKIINKYDYLRSLGYDCGSKGLKH